MFATREQFAQEILNREAQNFISRFLFEAVPHVFNGDLETWIEWKSELGKLLEVDPRNIVLTGSSATGFSLNPNKNFAQFSDASDIDCGIISPHHFDVAWRYLRQRRTEWLSLPSEIKGAIERHRKNYVFSGSIATDRILSLLPFGQPWRDALNRMSQLDPTIGREVKLRIYKDFEALREYQSIGLREAKGRIAEENVADYDLEDLAPIRVED